MEYETFRNKVVGKMPELKGLPISHYEYIIHMCHGQKYSVQDTVNELRNELK